VADTLGWVHHLAGNDTEAEALLASAVAGAPQKAEIRLHSAMILAANGKIQQAARELELALAQDKTFEQRDDVQRLRQKLRNVR
jgi:thioredoxin-like negative regulator of GroEL